MIFFGSWSHLLIITLMFPLMLPGAQWERITCYCRSHLGDTSSNPWLGSGNSLRICAWRGRPGGLQSMGSRNQTRLSEQTREYIRDFPEHDGIPATTNFQPTF